MSAMVLLTVQFMQPQAVDTNPASASSSRESFAAEFQAASEAYANRQFIEAATRFSALAKRTPDDANVLANWGTAAWAQGDTLSAVIGWQRAARRDRLSTDLQERLLLLPPGAREGVAELSMISAEVMWVAGAIAWLVGWALLTIVYARRRKIVHKPLPSFEYLRVPAYVLVFAAVVLGASAWWEGKNHDADALFVITRPETMRTQRGSDSDALGGVGTGDIVQRKSADGDWVEVEHADGRTGWLPMSRLVPLESSHETAE
jgi:hypothetical protein